MGEPSTDNRSSMEKGPSTHIHDIGFQVLGHGKAQVQATIVGEPSTDNRSSMEKGSSPCIHDIGFQVLGHGKVQVQATIVGDKHTPNGASASEGGTLLRIETDLLQHGKPQLMEGNDNHIIDIPAHAEEDYQNPSRKVAILFTGVSAQIIQSLVGGPDAMRLPEPIFYYAAAANALAFVASSLALLFLKKKPHAASILERVGCASAIATFLLMNWAVMRCK